MSETTISAKRNPAVPDVVALLNSEPALGLLRGQVGTVVESLDESTVLVEFSDDRGRAYAIWANRGIAASDPPLRPRSGVRGTAER